MDASVLKSINDDISRWNEINDSQRLKIIRSLKAFATIEKSSIPKDVEVSCPKHGYPLSGICNLKACPYHIDNIKSLNCLYHSLDVSKKKRLTSGEAASSMGMSVTQVNSLVNSGIQKIRVIKIEDEIESTRLNKFAYLDGHCANCGLNISDELDLGTNPGLIIEHGKVGYCSDTCKKEKAAWKVKLERRYGTDWEFVLIKALEYLSCIKASGKDVESLIGIDPHNIPPKDKAKLQKYRRCYHL